MGAGSQKLKGNNRTETIVLERISVARVPLRNFKPRKVSGINRGNLVPAAPGSS